MPDKQVSAGEVVPAMKIGNTRAAAGTLGTVELKHVPPNDDLAVAHLVSVVIA